MGHTPESCGRKMVKDSLRLKRLGINEYRFPETCTRVKIPDGYTAIRGPLGTFIIYANNGHRLMEVIPPDLRAYKEKHGVIEGQVWEHGEWKGGVK